jgi:ribose transport system permease protein
MIIKQYAALFLRLSTLIAISAFLSVTRPEFLTIDNIINVLRQSSLLFLLAAGLTVVVLTEGIDLSIGAILALSACVMGTLLKTHGIFLSISVGLLIGAGCGLVNGVLVALVGLPSFIATYGMLWIAKGLAVIFMNAEIIWGFPKAFRFFGAGNVFGIPTPIIIMLLVGGILFYMLKYTNLGRYIYSIGANNTVARFSGIPVNRTMIIAYVISGVLCAVAGVLYISRINAVEAGIGDTLLLPALAVVTIGGTSLFGGEGGIGGTLLGAIIMSVIMNGMNLLEVVSFWQNFAVGAIVIIAVFVDQFGSKKLSVS